MFDEQERMNALWEDYFAKDDAIRERYASERLDLQMYEDSENEYHAYINKIYLRHLELAENYTDNNTKI
jgi:hypothetical protein